MAYLTASTPCSLRLFGLAKSGFRDAQVATNLAGKWVGDLGMPGNRGTPIVGRVAPPGMTPSLADKDAAVPLEMADQVMPFHGLRLTSS
jgi:hypothetical protein